MTRKQLARGMRAAVAKFKSRNEPEKPASYSVAKKKVVCAHCGSTRFLKCEASGGITYLGEMAVPVGSSLYGLACNTCGRVEFFNQEPGAVEKE